MKNSFSQIEQAIDAIGARYPGSPRQEIILNRLFCHTMSRLTSYWNEAMKPYGLNETLWTVMIALFTHADHALYPSDISEALSFSRTNATRVADELVRQGWAQRQACSEDRRKIKLQLTGSGIALIEALLPRSRAMAVEQWRDFSQDERNQLEQLLRKLLTTLGG